jgi:glycosyltransferase involved in cell wall biosynthesis
MVTYNHEKYIKKSLDSLLLEQSILPDRIVICDDCSTDNTFSIIQDYVYKYPIIKAIKNENNLGIYGNLNKLIGFVSCGVVSFVSGDDFVTPNLFARFNKAIQESDVDILSESFIIVTNSIHLYTNGQQIVYNNYILKNTNLIKARLRYGLSFRSVGISANTLKQCKPLRTDLGIMADWLWGFDELVNTNKFIFLNESGAVYRLGVGITSKVQNIEFVNSKEKVLKQIVAEFGSFFDSSDYKYINYLHSQISFYKSKNLKNYYKMLTQYLRNFNNFTPNNSWVKNLLILLPTSIVVMLVYLKRHIR